MYRVETDDQAQEQVDALPAGASAFGAEHEGMLTYLILDDQRRVDVFSVLWIGA